MRGRIIFHIFLLFFHYRSCCCFKMPSIGVEDCAVCALYEILHEEHFLFWPNKFRNWKTKKSWHNTCNPWGTAWKSKQEAKLKLKNETNKQEKKNDFVAVDRVTNDVDFFFCNSCKCSKIYILFGFSFSAFFFLDFFFRFGSWIIKLNIEAITWLAMAHRSFHKLLWLSEGHIFVALYPIQFS